ncbi:MAG: hypothetical protein WC655_18735 [Candidatus Hydrogenedentales bacterium]|jgi:hypothetical protein
MNLKKQIVVVMGLVFALAVTGCPTAGPLVFGPYKIAFDNNCDEQDDSVDALFLYADGSLEYVADGVVKEGDWTALGTEFSMTINDYSGSEDLSGEATIDLNTLVDGTYSVSGIVPNNGCFSAEKAILQTQ